MQKKNAHLLIIEDNPRFLSEILQWLQDEFGYSEIATAVSVMDAEKKLLNPCDSFATGKCQGKFIKE